MELDLGIYERLKWISHTFSTDLPSAYQLLRLLGQSVCYAYVEHWLKAAYSASFLACEERPVMQYMGVLQVLA